MPAFVFPQLLLCGLFVDRDDMAPALDVASYALPLGYVFDAPERVTLGESFGGGLALDAAVTAGATLLALAAAPATLRRRTP
jgi:ABC-2 type transport system permease protein